MSPKSGVPHPDKEPDLGSDIKFGMQEEAKEHAWMSPSQIRRLVTDHLKMDPNYYEEDEDEAAAGTEEKGGQEDEAA